MNILITNLHSPLNLGDDAIMRATLDGLRLIYPGAKITAAANDPEGWARFKDLSPVPSICSWIGNCKFGKYPKLPYRLPYFLVLLFIAVISRRWFHKCFYFGSPEKKKLLQSYYEADLVLSCGGGNFYANRRLSPSLWMGLLAIAFPLALGKKVVMLPQSIGPIEGYFQNWMTGVLFRRVETIMVREKRSQNYLISKLRVRRPPILLPDLAFNLPLLVSKEEPSNEINIGLTIINRSAQKRTFHNQETYEKAILEVVLTLHQQYGAKIHIFAQCNGPSPDQDDREIANQMSQRLLVYNVPAVLHLDYHNALELREDYRRMDLLIGTRMHTAIIAFGVVTPVVLIGYQPKSCGMMEDFNLEEFCIDIDRVNPENLIQLVHKALHQRDELRNRILTKYQAVHQEARTWTNYL